MILTDLLYSYFIFNKQLIVNNYFYSMMKHLFYLLIIVSIVVGCKADKSIYKPKKRRKGKCDCPHLSKIEDSNILKYSNI